jgi:hypothetical protein
MFRLIQSINDISLTKKGSDYFVSWTFGGEGSIPILFELSKLPKHLLDELLAEYEKGLKMLVRATDERDIISRPASMDSSARNLRLITSSQIEPFRD